LIQELSVREVDVLVFKIFLRIGEEVYLCYVILLDAQIYRLQNVLQPKMTIGEFNELLRSDHVKLALSRGEEVNHWGPLAAKSIINIEAASNVESA